MSASKDETPPPVVDTPRAGTLPGEPVMPASTDTSGPETLKRPRRALVAAWASWDWGSAGINAVATTFVITVWLTSKAFVDNASNLTSAQLASALAEHSAWLGWGLSIAGVFVALLAPAMGKISDSAGSHKRMLAIWSGLVVVCLALIWFVRPEESYLWFGITLIAAANVFQEIGTVNYNSLLTSVSTDKTIGRVSGIGWASGYLGGIVLLSLLLVTFISPDVGLFGVSDVDATRYRAIGIVCAVWVLVFALPTVLFVPEPIAANKPVKVGFFESYLLLFRDVTRLWRDDRNILRFLIASAIFRDGLSGVFTFGGVLAAGTFGFSSSDVIVFAIVANIVAGIATISFGFLEDRTGAKPIIVGSLIALVTFALIVFIGGVLGAGAWMFWVFGLMLCVFVGPAQSASRTFLTRLTPLGKEGETFGLYATTGRAVSFLAPLAFSLFITLSALFVAGGDQIFGIIGIALVLFVGLLLLLPVKPESAAPGTGALRSIE